MAKPNTVELHRVIRAPADRIYRAFLEPGAIARWLPPYGFICTVHHMDAKVGGTFKMSFTNFGTGNGHSFGGEYLELVPGAKIVYTDQFDDPNLPGTITNTITGAEPMEREQERAKRSPWRRLWPTAREPPPVFAPMNDG